jgi:hypothetical protein
LGVALVKPGAYLSVSYEKFLLGIRKFVSNPLQGEERARLLKMLVRKIEILPEHFRLHYFVGRDHIENEIIAIDGLAAVLPISGSGDVCEKKEGAQATTPKFFRAIGSNTLTNGEP